MRRSTLLVAFGLTVTALLGGVWSWTRLASRRQAPQANPDASAILPAGSRSDFFIPQPIGEPIRSDERPQITNVFPADLDGDGLTDVLVCDAFRRTLTWIRQGQKGVFTETVLAVLPAPAHVEVIDFDGDGDLDLLVASLGELFPTNNRVGSVVVLENQGLQRFTSHIVASRIPRVADARAGDLDGDGDLDIAVAGFGHDTGETAWLENKNGWQFEMHVLQRLSGAINAIVADINQDGRLDIVALISQEWEEIWAFLNDGSGDFKSEMVWGSTNADFGSSWITLADLDRDRDLDILYSNGDAFDYAPANSRPWHGVQWLRNDGNMRFAFRRIGDLSGASSPQAADLDGDGDIDVAVVSAYNRWDDTSAQSLVWLENDGRQQFVLHEIASTPTHLITLAIADVDADGRADLVTGGMHISRPYDRMSRVTVWNNHAEPSTR